MAIAPNTTFVSGAILTAAQQNAFPRGVMAVQSLNTAFATSATHTTFQDTGQTITFTSVTSRIYKVTVTNNPYTPGGLQGVAFQIVIDSTAAFKYFFTAAMLEVGQDITSSTVFYYTATASASSTIKIQMRALGTNASVTDYAVGTTELRQLLVEDIGAA